MLTGWVFLLANFERIPSFRDLTNSRVVSQSMQSICVMMLQNRHSVGISVGFQRSYESRLRTVVQYGTVSAALEYRNDRAPTVTVGDNPTSITG